MAVPPLEAQLFVPVARHFQDRGYRVAREVDVNGRFADIVALGDDLVAAAATAGSKAETTGDLVAVELKLTDWRGALRQAMAYQVGVERSYVGLPLDTAMTVLRRRNAYEAEGVGLLAVHPPDGSVRELIPARRSPRHLPFLADRLREGFVRLA